MHTSIRQVACLSAFVAVPCLQLDALFFILLLTYHDISITGKQLMDERAPCALSPPMPACPGRSCCDATRGLPPPLGAACPGRLGGGGGARTEHAGHRPPEGRQQHAIIQLSTPPAPSSTSYSTTVSAWWWEAVAGPIGDGRGHHPQPGLHGQPRQRRRRGGLPSPLALARRRV